MFVLPAFEQFSHDRLTGHDLLEAAHSHRRSVFASARSRDPTNEGGGHLNIIFVSDATARARSLTLDWRHWTVGAISVLVLFLSFTLLFNYVTRRYAASIKHPLLQAIVLADQRQEAQKTQEVVEGHLNLMAVKL